MEGSGWLHTECVKLSQAMSVRAGIQTDVHLIDRPSVREKMPGCLEDP